MPRPSRALPFIALTRASIPGSAVVPGVVPEVLVGAVVPEAGPVVPDAGPVVPEAVSVVPEAGWVALAHRDQCSRADYARTAVHTVRAESQR